MASPRDNSETKNPKRAPATTPQARENQLIALAMDQAEKQIRAGTATSQVIVHFLKLGTAKENLERSKLERENELLKARVEDLRSSARSEELTERAIKAFQSYATGSSDEGEDDEY